MSNSSYATSAFCMIALMASLLIIEVHTTHAGRDVAAKSTTTAVVHPNDMSYVSSKCRGSSFAPWTPYGHHVTSVLSQLVENTPYAAGYEYNTRTPGNNAPAFGYAGCAALLASNDDCEACLRKATSDILSVCNNAIAARLHYQDCWVRYEDHYFNGGMTGN